MMSEAKFKAKTKGTGLKIKISKQMFQRLPIALAQLKAAKNSESLLSEKRQIVYSLYQSKQITKKGIQPHTRIYSITCKKGHYIYEFGKQ